MRPQSAKAKGRRLCKRFKEILDYVFKFEDGDVRVTSSGVTGEDILLSPHAQRLFPYSTECKNQETLQLWKSWDQARQHSTKTGRTPVLIIKRNGSEMLAVIPADHFVSLVRDANGTVVGVDDSP